MTKKTSSGSATKDDDPDANPLERGFVHHNFFTRQTLRAAVGVAANLIPGHFFVGMSALLPEAYNNSRFSGFHRVTAAHHLLNLLFVVARDIFLVYIQYINVIYRIALFESGLP
ncbi:hypothetical protein [Paenibacillus lactis]|uniref:hypothetical protein n=1 Tax=Paenibacillus lactis TaxID=228574 RepID=UPI00110F917A|nr:hypothetical protein [Paenibacillus lactis]